MTGLHNLVSLLNMIANRDIEEAYSLIEKLPYSYDEKRDLLRWASAYSRKGNILFDRFNDDRKKLESMDSSIHGVYTKV